MVIDLVFPASGHSLPTDHAFPLYAALSRAMSAFHDEVGGVRFATISGKKGIKGQIALGIHSSLRVRCTSDVLPRVIGLAGQSFEVADSKIVLRPPTVEPLSPTASLFARVVIFKNCEEPQRFLNTARDKLRELDIRGEPGIAVNTEGERAGEAQRRVVRIHGKMIVGYSLVVEGLSATESLLLQERGLGGRTRMGCGFFMPLRTRG